MTTAGSTILFMLNPYASYPMTLLELEHTNGRVVATVEANPEIWEYVDLLMFFNLRWDVRNEGFVSGTKPVQVKIVLDKELYNSLQSSGQLLADQQAFFNSPLEHPMRKTTSWYALEVTEETDLPDRLKELGSLREGFTTKWKDNL